MDEYELLVHVTAPGRVADDRHYLSIAQAIIDFQATTLTNLAADDDYIDSSNSTIDLSSESTELASQPLPDGFTENQPDSAELASFIAESLPPSPQPFIFAKKPSDLFETHSFIAESLPPSAQPQTSLSPTKWQFTKLNEAETPHHPTYNIAHQNTSYGPRSQELSYFATPYQQERPRTAPEQLPSTVNVPRTAFKRRRAFSDSPSLGSFTSWVSNSQPSPYIPMADRGDPLSPDAIAVDEPKTDPGLEQFLSQASLEDEPQLKRRRLDHRSEIDTEFLTGSPLAADSPNMQRDGLPNMTCSSTASGAATPQSSSPIPGLPSQPAHDSNLYFLRDRSLDWSSSASSGSIDPTASDSRRIFPEKSGVRQEYRVAGGSESSPIDLTSSSSPKPYAPGARIRALSTEIAAPAPPTGIGKFETHITRHMEDLARRLPFKKSFRPIEVARDVKVLERGSWTMSITVAEDGYVTEMRKPPTFEERARAYDLRFAAPTSKETMEKYFAVKDNEKERFRDYDYGFENKAQELWTENEFLRFWDSMDRFIKDGKAGWATKLVREEDVEIDSSDPGELRIMRMRLRMFTWGEVVGHSYLALWVLSDKVAARTPMEWVSGDGSAVVKMAGTEMGRGSLGIWRRKGPEGEKGLWGMCEE